MHIDKEMSRFKTPSWARDHLFEYRAISPSSDIIYKIKAGLSKFKVDNPLVSIIIPVYNEQENILNLLSSVASMEPAYPTECIIVNNNSTDCTAHLLEICGANVVFESNQGITNARHTGMQASKGKIILSADADSIYPPQWVNAYVEALHDPNVACAYGKYSFLPLEKNRSKFFIGVFEYLMQLKYISRKLKGREYLNVYGFNSGFRKEDAIKIGGYNLKNQIWEDGRLALDLMQLGKLELLKDPRSWVMTSSRKFMRDGGLIKAFWLRIENEIKRIFLKKVAVETH